MDRHRRLGTMGPTVREIYKLDDIAYFGKFCKQVSWKKILFWGLATPGFFLFLFFYQGFLSRTLKTHRAAEEGRGHLFATLHVRWLSHIFNRIACIYQTVTRWDLPPYRITILIDWCDIKCLLTWWLDFSFFVIAIYVGKPVDSNSHRLLPLYYKWTD